jgi:F0F1-type ATP synthase assembly protein I
MAQPGEGGGPPRDDRGFTPERRKTPRTTPRSEGPGPATYAGFGLQFVVALLLFLYLGQWADRKLGTSPIFLLIGVFVGAGGAFYSMYRSLMKAQAREEAEKKDRTGK